ncbi:polymeric immunoglobulin receptor-like [Sardina pilchardus]|uniref:polymeric immunoglobulin receptor-like n=1 Tax=Sardina pilchardus TaxID=27697 RepID=UPI002E0EDE9B
MDFTILILLTNLQGIFSISSVSEVPVGKGQTLIIPCHYNAAYRHEKKIFYGYYYYGSYVYYWDWRVIVDSGHLSQSDRVTMSDDPEQTVFTVTMRNVAESDEGSYQFNIEGSSRDEYKNVYISVKDSPALYVPSQAETGYVDGSVTINCYYKTDAWKKWCRIDGACADWNYIDGMRVDMSTDADKGVFKVIMTRLQLKHTGWYYCSVGDQQMPVHITVIQKTTTQRTQQPAINTTTTRTTSTVDFSSTSTTDETHTQNGFSLTLPLRLLWLLLLVVIYGALTLIRRKKRRRAADPDEAVSERKSSAALQNSQEDPEVTDSMIAMTPSENAADDPHVS